MARGHPVRTFHPLGSINNHSGVPKTNLEVPGSLTAESTFFKASKEISQVKLLFPVFEAVLLGC